MAQYLSEDEVFGQPVGTIKADSTGGYLSDAEVFGNSEPTDSEQQVVTSARAWRGAGAGRGSFNDPRRLDTAQGRRTLDVERELDRYETLNPGESRESMRGAAEASVDARPKSGKPVSRQQQYMDKGYGEKDAAQNAAFDEGLEEKLQSRMDAKPVAESATGERIATPYNPINEESRVKDLIRRDLAVRDRSLGDFVVDAYSAIGQGLVNIPKMAVDVVAPDSPLAASLQAELKNVSARESDIIKARNELMQMSVAQREDAIGKYGETIRQLVTNPSLGVQEFARQVPLIAAMAMSAGAGGVLGRGAVSVAGRASAPVVLADAISGGAIAARGASVGSTAAGIGAAGIMAGGDAAGSTYDRLMDRAQTPDSALAQNPDYQALLSAGKTPDEARREIAATKARMAAIAAAPLGLLGFAGAESAIAKRIIGQGERMTAGRAAGMVAKDNLGEQLEEGGTQLASNAAIASLDPRQSLMQGVPEAMATAAVTSAPFAAATGVAEVMAPAAGVSVPYRDAPGIVRGVDAQPAVDEAINAAVASTMAEREKAMAGIGAAGSVEEAVAAANAAVQLTGRAVQLDNDRLLNQALAKAGIDESAQGVPAEVQPDLQAAGAGAQEGAADAAALAAERTANYAPSSVVWTGRRGDGYATTEDAMRALSERQRLRPNYEWSVRQNPEGRYVLEGLPKPQDGAVAGVSPAGNTEGAQRVQNAPERAGLAEQLAEAGFAQPRETIRDLRDQADQVQRLQAAIARAGDDASGLQLYAGSDTGGGDRLHSADLGGRPVSAGVGDAAAAVRDVGLASKVAFGWRPIPVTGLKNAYGVQFGGQVFVDVGQLAGAGQKLGKPEHVAIQTIGHETTHSLEKSADPQDRADYALLRQAVLANAKDGVVSGRVTREAAELVRLPGETDAQFSARAQRYGENEVVADVSGNFWLDPKFWSRLYDLDASAMRRIAYKFMENATKLVKAVKGSRLDNARFIRNIEQVREVAAQVWASKAKRGDLFAADGKQPEVGGDQPSFKRAGQSNFEVAPDPNDTELSARWAALPLARKLEISRMVAQSIVPKVLELRGAVGEIVDQVGSYLNDTNPSFALKLTQGDLHQVSMDLGYVLSQDSMMNLSMEPFDGGSEVGAVVIELGDKSFAEIDALYQTLRNAVPEVGGQSFAGGEMVVLNYSDTPTSELARRVDIALGGQYNVSEGTFYSSFPEKKDYDYASGSIDAGARSKAEAGVRSRLGVLRAEATKAINDGIAGQPRADRSGAEGTRAGNGDRGQADGREADNGQPLPASWSRDGGVPAVDGAAGEPPRYGSPREGAVSVTGYHFSRQPRQSLSSAFYGSGLKGEEAKRLEGAENADIRPRVFFYVDRGNGVMPESGVGPHPHHVRMDNLYDVTSDPLGIVKSTRGMPGNRANNWERAVMQAGFDGYVSRDPVMPQHFAVLLGRGHSSVPVASANPRRLDGKANIAPAEQSKPQRETIRKGDELVRKPEGAEVMEIIAAQKAGIAMAAPSFKMQWGEARVLESEAEAADAVFEQTGAKFRFGKPEEGVSYSRDDFNELGAFNLDVSDDIDNESLSFLDDDKTLQTMLQAELEAEQSTIRKADAAANAAVAPSMEAIKKAGYRPETAFDSGGTLVYDLSAGTASYSIPAFARGSVFAVKVRASGGNRVSATVDMVSYGSYMGTNNPEVLERFIGLQMAGAYLHDAGFDLASTYRKGTIQRLASTWKSVAKASGFFKLGTSEPKTMVEAFENIGAFKEFEISEEPALVNGKTIVFTAKDGNQFTADYHINEDRLTCCTLGLDGSGGMGTQFYAAAADFAKAKGLRFFADDMISGINTYRRVEQALSYALKTGRTDVLLPGGQNRVYGYNFRPKTTEDHDANIARLAIASLRNTEEVFPEVRRLRYDPAADAFTDSSGKDAEAMVKEALRDPVAREFGLGRTTVARAALTSQILRGELSASDVTEFDSPIAYSLADVGMDEPISESWGDSRDGVNSLTPGLRRFISGSKIVKDDGTPVVMYHGTARDIHAFRAKQAGAIFVTYSPKFADDFAALSEEWMRSNWREVLTPEQIERAKKSAAAAIMADKSIKMTERRALKQSIMDGNPDGMAADAMVEAVAAEMPSGPNIIPVVVRATAPFDFRIPGHVADLIYTLQERQGVDPGGDVTIQLVKEGGQKMTVSEDDLAMALRSGMWEFIEAPEVQAVIREDLGHDGFFVKETGQVNLAVYEPTQLKSVFNSGAYSLEDKRLSYSRAELDSYMVRRNKTMPTISGAAAQEADIALAVKVIEAAGAEIERGNKAILPIPLGRTPHVLGMFRAPNKMLRIDTSILKKVLFDKHSEDFADVSAERFVRAIYQPAMVLRGRAAGEFEIVTDIITKKGPIMVPVMTGGDGPSAAVMSAYAKNVNGSGESLLKRIKGGALLYADPVLAQIAVTGREPERIRGIITSGAQFPSAPPQRAQADTVNQPDLYVKPLNPYYAGWDRAREAILGGIRERKVKSDVDLMRRIGDLYRGDWEDAPSFSRSSPAVWTGDEAVSVISKINGRIAGGAARVNLAATFADLPQDVQDAAASAGVSPGEFRGVTMRGGNVWVVQDGHSSLADLESTVIHEVYGHVGLRALFGPDIYRRLNKLYLSLGERRVAELTEKYGLVRAGYNEMARSMEPGAALSQRAGGADAVRNGWLMEELLAHIAEQESGTIRQRALEVVGAIRDWLRTNGFAALADLGMADIAHILRRGRIASETQPGLSGVDAPPAFSRADTEGSPGYSKAAGYDLPVESFWYKARRKMQDYFIRARLVQEAIASQGGVVDEKTDFYRAEELSHGRISALLQDFADQQVQPLMEKAVKYGIELDELSLYAYAMHAKERNAYIASIDKKMPDGGSGMTNADADAVIRQVKASPQAQQMEELHADLMTITRANRLAMLADGLITQDEFNALEGAYEFYVPLRGFEVRDEDGKPTGRSAGKGINIRGPETLKAKGRKTRAGQIIENIISDHQRTIVRGERNHVGKVFLNFVLQNPDDSLWEIDATTTRKAFDRQTGRIARNTAIEKGEDTIAVKVQGREIYIKIKDDLLLRALRKTYTDETGELTNDLMRSVGLYSTLLRNTLTRYNPEFAVVNAMRDFGFGATAMLDELGEKGAAKFTAHYAGAVAASARNESKKLGNRDWDKWFLEYKATGGMTSGFYAKGLDEISSDIRDMMIEAGAAPKDWSERVRFNKATRAAKAALRVLEYAGSVSENAARVAAYRTAREMGKSPSEAASIAKNLTTNFDRKGEYGQLLNALYLFYNAAIQGTQRTLKMFRNPKVMGYMSGVTAASVTLALMSATAGGDDPDDGMAYWDKIPSYVKERNIIIMLPPGEQMEGAERVGTKGRYLTIPVQYGLNIFHVFGYQIADVIRHQRDATRGASPAKAGVNLASAVAGSFNPLGGAVDLTNASSTVQAILPTVFDFPYQLATGTNAFGRDVAPYKSPFDSKPDSQNSNVRQAGTPAEHVAQWLNSVTGGSEYEPGAIDISAGTVENVVRNLTGGTGMFIYDALALTGKTVESYTGGDPDLFVRDIPILRRVYGESGGDVDQGLFYERRKAIQEAASIVRGAEEADVEIKDKEKLALASLNKPAGKYTRELTKLRKQMKEVQRDESLTDLERKTAMRELRAERDRLTAEFNREFMDLMREELASSVTE